MLNTDVCIEYYYHIMHNVTVLYKSVSSFHFIFAGSPKSQPSFLFAGLTLFLDFKSVRLSNLSNIQGEKWSYWYNTG